MWNSFSLLQVSRPCYGSLTFLGVREPTSAAALACLLSPAPGVSVSLPSHRSLRIYHSCVLKPLKWEQVTRRHEEEQVLFGVGVVGGSTPVNFLFLLFWLSGSISSPSPKCKQLPSLFHPITTGPRTPFIPELQPRAMAHSLHWHPTPQILAKGVPWKLELSRHELSPWRVCHPSE